MRKLLIIILFSIGILLDAQLLLTHSGKTGGITVIPEGYVELRDYTWTLNIDEPIINEHFQHIWYDPQEDHYWGMTFYINMSNDIVTNLWYTSDLENWTEWKNNPWWETGNDHSTVDAIEWVDTGWVICHFKGGSGGEMCGYTFADSVVNFSDFDQNYSNDEDFAIRPNEYPAPYGSSSLFPQGVYYVSDSNRFYSNINIAYIGDYRIYENKLYSSSDLVNWEYEQVFIPESQNLTFYEKNIVRGTAFFDTVEQREYAIYAGYDDNPATTGGVNLIWGDDLFNLNAKRKNYLLTEEYMATIQNLQKWKTSNMYFNEFTNEYEMMVAVLYYDSTNYWSYKLTKSGTTSADSITFFKSEKPILDSTVIDSYTNATVYMNPINRNNGYRWRIANDTINWDTITTSIDTNWYQFDVNEDTIFYVQCQTLGDGQIWDNSFWSNVVAVLTNINDLPKANEYDSILKYMTDKTLEPDSMIQNYMLKRMVDSGLYELYDIMFMPATTSEANAYMDWKNPSSVDTLYYITYGGRGIHITNRGITPGGLEKMGTHYNPSTDAVNFKVDSGFMAMYNYYDHEQASPSYNASDGTGTISVYVKNSDDNAVIWMNSAPSAPGNEFISVTRGDGMSIVNKINSDSIYYVMNNVATKSPMTTTALPNDELEILVNNYSCNSFPFFAVGYSLTQKQWNDLTIIFEDYLRFFGNGVMNPQ